MRLDPDLVTEKRSTEILEELDSQTQEEVAFYLIAAIGILAKKRATTPEDVIKSIVESRIEFLISAGEFETLDGFILN